ADFSATPTTGKKPVDVDFTDLTSSSVSTWAWDFGDGGTSTLKNPTHQYTVAGSYTVSLMATGPGGQDTDVKTGYIAITDGTFVKYGVGSSGVAGVPDLA